MKSQQSTAAIGAQTLVKGTVEGTEDLVVSGRLEGRVKLGETLVIEPDGIVAADVQAKRVVVSGTLVGNVMATEVVQINAQGRVVGDLSAPRLVLAEGGAYRGNVNMSGRPGPSSAARTARSAASQSGPASATSATSEKPRTTTKTTRKGARPVRNQASRGQASRGRAPKPPTAAGKKSRAKRK